MMSFELLAFCVLAIGHFFAALRFSLIGCGTATISPEQTASPNVAIQRPDKIVVYRLSASVENVI